MKPTALATLLLPAGLNPHACPQSPGDIRWQLQTTDLSAGFRPRPAPDGSLYWNPGFTLYAISPSGQVSDLLILLSFWGPCLACEADLDGDGNVGFGDLLFLLAHWTG